MFPALTELIQVLNKISKLHHAINASTDVITVHQKKFHKAERNSVCCLLYLLDLNDLQCLIHNPALHQAITGAAYICLPITCHS
jgi:hypothetical protein